MLPADRTTYRGTSVGAIQKHWTSSLAIMVVQTNKDISISPIETRTLWWLETTPMLNENMANRVQARLTAMTLDVLPFDVYSRIQPK